MKIKTTMLSGVAGALALAAFMSSTAMYGAAHLDPAVFPTADWGDITLDDPDTDPITGDILIAKDGTASVITPTTPVLDPISPELQNEVVGDGLLEVFSPLSVEGQTDAAVSGQSGVEIQDEGNVSLFSTTSTTDVYAYDLARKTFIQDETDGAAPGTNGLPLEVGGVVVEELVAGYWENTGTESEPVWVFNEYTGTYIDGGGELTAGFKTFLADNAAGLDNLSGDPYVTLGDPTTSGGNLLVEGDATIEGQLDLGELVDVESLITGNVSAIAMNTSDIGVNTSDIGVNEGGIAWNASAIAVNVSDIGVNTAGIAVNVSDIGVNTAGIAVNVSDIGVNTAGIAVNVSDIGVNAAGIAVNVSDIADNSMAIGMNTSAIGVNASGILSNEAAIDLNASGITALDNQINDDGGISDQVSDLNFHMYNDAGIVGQIGDNVSDLNELIYLDEDGATHIGPDSLVTQYDSEDDDQNLWAENPEGDVVDINAITNINVSPGDLPGTEISIASADGQVNPTIDPDLMPVVAPVDDTTAVYTLISEVTETETDYSKNGGVLLETNGNVTLTAAEGTQDTVKYVTAVRADIYNADQGDDAGTTAQEVRVGGYLDANGDFVELAALVDVDGQWLIDPAYTPSAEEETVLKELGYWVEDEDITGTGGNLHVDGNAVVMGKLSAGAIDDVEMAIGDNAAGIETNASDIATNVTNIETNASDIADNTTAIGDEATARADADDELQGQIDDNADTLDVHFGLVSGNIADIASNAGRISSLESAMDMARMDIDTNTRGIAMVAALTHTTILPGMENALDISMAYFEGETGISISYSRRVNESTQINFAAASTSDFEESVVRAGIGWQW